MDFEDTPHLMTIVEVQLKFEKKNGQKFKFWNFIKKNTQQTFMTWASRVMDFSVSWQNMREAIGQSTLSQAHSWYME